MDKARKLRFTYFTTFSPGGPPYSQWDHPGTQEFDFLSFADWAELARTLEAAKVDGIFFADHIGVHDTYRGSASGALETATQFPVGDPALLISALAQATTELCFAMSANVIQEHPYMFARRIATLDHLTGGRVGWNIVTSFQRSAWRNLGMADVATHSDRYARAEEYVQVLYKLLEGSWEDGAVIRDAASRAYADPAKVHPVDHVGANYTVPGMHTLPPSPQRTPLLFQAGTSEDGRAFSARNAEAMFISARNPRGVSTLIADMVPRLEAVGRRRSDILFFTLIIPVVGSTEEEAKRKNAEVDEYLDIEALLTLNSSMLGADLSQLDLESPVGDFKTDAMIGPLRAIVEAAPDKSWTFRELVTSSTSMNRIVGTPEQLADTFEEWQRAGLDGVNFYSLNGIEGVSDFAHQVAPVLQKRGIMQSEYAPGTFREKLSLTPAPNAALERLQHTPPPTIGDEPLPEAV